MVEDKTKDAVIARLDEFCKDKFEDIEFSTEGSLTDSYKYMSLENVKKVLEECFDVTRDELFKLRQKGEITSERFEIFDDEDMPSAFFHVMSDDIDSETGAKVEEQLLVEMLAACPGALKYRPFSEWVKEYTGNCYSADIKKHNDEVVRQQDACRMSGVKFEFDNAEARRRGVKIKINPKIGLDMFLFSNGNSTAREKDGELFEQFPLESWLNVYLDYLNKNGIDPLQTKIETIVNGRHVIITSTRVDDRWSWGIKEVGEMGGIGKIKNL